MALIIRPPVRERPHHPAKLVRIDRPGQISLDDPDDSAHPARRYNEADRADKPLGATSMPLRFPSDHWWPLGLCLFAALVAVGCSPSTPSSEAVPAAEASASLPLAEAASTGTAQDVSDTPTPSDPPWTRVTWVRDVGDGTDVLSFGDQLVLMGRDSRDGQGERVILAEPKSYAKPLMTPDGAQIVFSIREERAVYVINWDGSGLRRLGDGFGLAVWKEPDRDIVWVYVGAREMKTDPPSYRAVRRYRIDRPQRGERVWTAQRISADSFQLSADGRYAGGLFPWPRAGVADLEAGTWEELGEGCWTAFAVDDSHIFWYFDGLHRNLTMVDIDTDHRWRVTINGPPGVDGYEVWHPRWTNNPRYLTLTGPYTVGGRDNKIRGGGDQVEVFVGRFSADLTRVEAWHQITKNSEPDFYPDAWIGPTDEPVRLADNVGSGHGPAESPQDATTRLVVDARVARDVALPTPASIAPYRHGLLAMEYDVVEVLEGAYDEPTLVVAHWVIRDGEVLANAGRAEGHTQRLTLELYEARRELEGQRLVMDSTNFTLPLYYDVDSAP